MPWKAFQSVWMFPSFPQAGKIPSCFHFPKLDAVNDSFLDFILLSFLFPISHAVLTPFPLTPPQLPRIFYSWAPHLKAMVYTRAVFHCLSQAVSRQLNEEWSSWYKPVPIREAGTADGDFICYITALASTQKFDARYFMLVISFLFLSFLKKYLFV